MEELYSNFGVKTVRVDAGGTLNGILLQEGLVTEVSFLVHPCIVGNKVHKSFYDVFGDIGADTIALQLEHFEKVSDDLLWLRYIVL
jgi:2,5-diamino-6-(ribosylamino)-4(3H)-pyrimidinone 5'-phosphate reductase